MPNIYFILFELIIYLQFALCLHHAWKQGMPNLLRLFAGVLFGVVLELATIRQLNAYEYGRFIIMIIDVPLCIGVAWSCIIYSVMEFSEASNLPYWARPILDGLLALNIDLALDTVAIRLGFWDWGQGLGFQYFGVPYANFWAWFWVVSSFSLGYRLVAWRADQVGRWLSPWLALMVGLIGVLGTNSLITFSVPFEHHDVLVLATLILALVFTISLRPRFYSTPAPALVFWVPFLTHGYLLAAGLVTGVIFEPSVLLFIAFVMLIVALYLHRPTIRHIFQRDIKPRP
jgi:hypothetical protein